jgi:hypothetical protein
MGAKHPTGSCLINSQNPIFPKGTPRTSYTNVHETEKYQLQAIEGEEEEVKRRRSRYTVTRYRMFPAAPKPTSFLGLYVKKSYPCNRPWRPIGL